MRQRHINAFWSALSLPVAHCNVAGCSRQCWNHYQTCYRHTPVSRETLYRVWQALTANPRLSIRELACKPADLRKQRNAHCISSQR